MTSETTHFDLQDWILDSGCNAQQTIYLGGKADSLRHLDRESITVPKWFCLSTQTYQELAYNLVQEHISKTTRLKHAGNGVDTAITEHLRKDLVQRLTESGITAIIQNKCVSEFNGAPLVVRSSANIEDSSHSSFSGQFSSYLNIDCARIDEYIVDCWLSGINPGILSYLEHRRIAVQDIQIAVIIQEMISSSASGVCFSVNPNGNEQEVVCVAGLGLGEGIVSDRVETDQFIYNRVTHETSATISQKTSKIVPNRGSIAGTTMIPVPAQQQGKPALDDRTLSVLIKQVLEIENANSTPQDIEWATDDSGKLYILQARPVTSSYACTKILYDNANIVEGYPGISSPLTASVIRQGYSELFRNFILDLGVPRDKVTKKRALFENLLGYIYGRMYLNLNSWYGFFALIPGTESYVNTWEQMMGLPHAPDRHHHIRVNIAKFFRLAAIVSRMTIVFIRLDRHCRLFNSQADETVKKHWYYNATNDDLSGLTEKYWSIHNRLTNDMVITLYNDGYAFIFTGLVKKQLVSAGAENANDILNQLLSGENNLPSIEPIRSALRLADLIRNDSQLCATLKKLTSKRSTEQNLITQLELLAPKFATNLKTHLDLFGDRFIEELKLESVSARDKPEQMVRMILSYADTGLSEDRLLANEQHNRDAAEKTLRRVFLHKPARLLLFRFYLFFAKRSIRHREALRLSRARYFGVIRNIFIRIGTILRDHGVIGNPEDVFFLDTQQIFGFINGNSPNPELASIIELQRKAFAGYESRRPVNRFTSRGSPFLGAQIQSADTVPAQEKDTIFGQGCAPGIVEAEAIVLKDPANIEFDVKGKILVAEMTDPGWVYLMIPCAGLVSERGSVLSHTAIIGRELGIATIVGAKHATRLIKTGDRIRINGSTGEIVRVTVK